MQNYINFNDYEKRIVEEDLASIAFLFKHIEFRNEQEIRILTNGDTFNKKINQQYLPPKIYIELIPLKNYITHIKFGPKVDNHIEWTASLHYAYDKRPCIDKSQLPYK